MHVAVVSGVTVSEQGDDNTTRKPASWQEGSSSKQVPSDNVPGPFGGEKKGKKEADASLPWKIKKWSSLVQGKKVAGQKPWRETVLGDQLGQPAAIAEKACGQLVPSLF